MPVIKTERDWEVEQALKTLVEAEEIKKDQSLYNAAMNKLQRDSELLKKVDQSQQVQQNISLPSNDIMGSIPVHDLTKRRI
jgi:hypothetical protein